MTVTREPDGTRRSQFDQANPNQLGELMRKMALGSYLQGQALQVRRQVGTGAAGSNQLKANAYNLPAMRVLKLPDGGKCSIVRRVTVRASGVVNGEFAALAYGATPITRQVAPTPNGDLAFLGLDAVTDADVVYIPERGDVVEVVLPVTLATGVCTLPAWLTAKGIVLLEEAEVLEGTVLGPKIVLVPAAGAPAAGFVQLSVAKALVQFDPVADIPTRARFKFLVAPAEPLANVLEAASDTL
jgi:hypothetical protein